MEQYPWTALVTLLALVTYLYMGLRVGGARAKYKVAAPAITGDPMFERHFRVHMNTLEWLPLFLAPLWLFASYWGDQLAAGAGAVWIVGRLIYMAAYVKDPGTRSAGFGIQALVCLALTVGAFIGVGQQIANTLSVS